MTRFNSSLNPSPKAGNKHPCSLFFQLFDKFTKLVEIGGIPFVDEK